VTGNDRHIPVPPAHARQLEVAVPGADVIAEIFAVNVRQADHRPERDIPRGR
jgi:hypothetical protein